MIVLVVVIYELEAVDVRQVVHLLEAARQCAYVSETLGH